MRTSFFDNVRRTYFQKVDAYDYGSHTTGPGSLYQVGVTLCTAQSHEDGKVLAA